MPTKVNIMNKIALVTKREYLTRVKKKSFIIMTILAPVLLAGMIMIPAWIMTREDGEEKKIVIVGNGSEMFEGKIPSTKNLKFEFLPGADPDTMKETYESLGYYGMLFISEKLAYVPNAVYLYSQKQPTMEMTMHITNALESEIERQKLEAYDIRDIDKILKEVESDVQLQTIQITSEGTEKKTSTGLSMGIAYISGLLIYMLTFIFGAQVMRGVIEEKTSRIVEVLISSVRPFQLMMGKILGIAMVGLTQFILWIILTLIIVGIAQSVFLPEPSEISGNPIVQDIMSSEMTGEIQANATAMNEFQSLLESIRSMPWLQIIGSFIFYFLGGYLLYASLFAAVGAAVDNETDTQQFMMPITIPLLLGLFVTLGAFQNPNTPLVFWFSFIPFTSPMVMMARIPFGVPFIELVISMVLLVLFFIGTTWVAAKIYRTGILMYGKKPTYKEIMKWVRYKNY
jgi:ABC-2 type transport system permease protein